MKCKVNLVKRATYWSGKLGISFHPRDFYSSLSSPFPTATPRLQTRCLNGGAENWFWSISNIDLQVKTKQLIITPRSSCNNLQTQVEVRPVRPPGWWCLLFVRNPNMELSSQQISRALNLLISSHFPQMKTNGWVAPGWFSLLKYHLFVIILCCFTQTETRGFVFQHWDSKSSQVKISNVIIPLQVPGPLSPPPYNYLQHYLSVAWPTTSYPPPVPLSHHGFFSSDRSVGISECLLAHYFPSELIW